VVRRPGQLKTTAAPLVGLGLLWFIPSMLAMLAYADRYGFRWTLLVPHAALLGVLLTLVLAGLLLIAGWPLSRALGRALLTLWLAGLHLGLVLCYALCFMAWEAWNQPPSVAVVLAYVPQLPQTLSALPVSAALPALAGLALVAVFVIPYGFASGPLLDAGARLGASLVARVRAWSSPWRWAACVAGLVIGPAVLLRGGWEHRQAMAATQEPFINAWMESGRSVGSMQLDAGSAARALAERDVARNYVPPATSPRKTLVLITVDALRADQTSAYGAGPMGRDTTPFLRGLQASGRLARVSPAYSVCTESFCGLLGVLTSKYWHQAAPGSFGLPDVLKRIGYRVTFLLGGDHTRFYGLRAAYGEAVDDYQDGSTSEGYLNDDFKVLDGLRDYKPQRGVPQFLFMHLMSAHPLGLRHAEYRRWSPSEIGVRALGTEQLVPAYVNNYHNGILQADAVIERIFGLLRDKGLLEDAIVVITADHGELIGEEGRVGHARPVPLEGLVRVPLLIWDSEGFRYPAHAVASQVDVAPTLLDRIGARVPGNWAGAPLTRPVRRAGVCLQTGTARGIVVAIGGGLWKYLVDSRSGLERAVDVLAGDREEVNRLDALDAATISQLRSALQSTCSGKPAQ
jgi:hypothetical protein